MLKFTSWPPERGNVQFSEAGRSLFDGLGSKDEEERSYFKDHLNASGEVVGSLLVANMVNPTPETVQEIVADLTAGYTGIDDYIQAFQAGVNFGVGYELDLIHETRSET